MLRLGFCTLVLNGLIFGNYGFIPHYNQTIEDYCIEDTGVSDDMVAKILADPDREFIEEENCYLHCIYSESGYINEEGSLILEKFEAEKQGNVSEIDMDCLKAVEKILECNDIKILKNCKA